MQINLTEEEIKLIIAFMERAQLTGQEVSAYNRAVAPLIRALKGGEENART